jgi:hypothetical protein
MRKTIKEVQAQIDGIKTRQFVEERYYPRYFYDDMMLSNRDLNDLDWSDKSNPREYSFLVGHINVVKEILDLCDESSVWHCSTNFSLFPDEGFSHDNMTAVVSYFTKIHGIGTHWSMEGWRRLLNQPYLHPRDIAYYAYCAGKWWSPFTLWIAALCSLESCLPYHTNPSGKLLAWLRIMTLKDKSLLFAAMHKIFKTQYVSWFERYFSLGGAVIEDHPCVEYARRVYA